MKTLDVNLKKDLDKGKVILFSPKPHPYTTYRGAPLSLLTISGPLEKAGYNIKIVDAQVDHDYPERIISYLEGAICLGISSMTGYQIHDGLKVAKLVKEKYPHIKIVWGGFHPSIKPVQTVNDPYVDIVVRGQGEVTFFEVVNCLKDNLSLNNVLGITFKENGKIIENPERPMEDLNNFPPLPYHLIDMEKYIKYTEIGSRTVEYVSSQACPHRCKFCAEPLVFKRKWKGKKAQRVVDEIENLVNNYNVNAIIFSDNNFFANKERIRGICQGFIDRKLNIRWGRANGRTNHLCKFDDDLWDTIKKSGCHSILVGAESGSQDILNLINKDTKVEDTIRLAEICNRYGVRITFSCMIGLPPDPNNKDNYLDFLDKEFHQTIDMIDRVLSISNDNGVLLFVYSPYPGTPLYDLSIENGFREPRSLEEWSGLTLNKKNTPWMPQKYVDLTELLCEYIFKYKTNYQRNRITRTRRFKILYNFLYRILHHTASFRWKYKFFTFPVEFKLLVFYSKWKNRTL